MNASTLDPLGNPVGLLNATPLQIANTFYGVQNYLALVTSASLTAVLLQDRDSFSANLGRQERHQLAAATNTTTTGPLDYAGLYGSLSWQHDLRPGLQSTLFAQWGTTTQSGQPAPPPRPAAPARATIRWCSACGFPMCCRNHQHLRAIQLVIGKRPDAERSAGQCADQPGRHRRAQDILSTRT